MIDTRNPLFSLNFLAKEVGILRTLNHESFIQFYDVIRYGDHFMILTELCQGRDLFYWLKNNGQSEKNAPRDEFLGLSLHERLYIFEKIIHAIQYLWSRHIVHRDIK